MKKRIYHDITMDFSEDIAVFPGDPKITIKEHMSIAKGDIVNLSMITFGSHTSTHIDAPRHFFDQGLSVDELPLEHFMGKAKVFEFQNRDAITAEDLHGLDIQKGDIVLFKTRNSSFLKDRSFHKDFVYIAPDAARYLVEAEIKTVGIDYLTIDPFGGNGFESHYALLGKGIVLIEGLDLEVIQPGEYEISALPVKIKNGNGSPVRAVLIEEKEE